MSSSSSTPTTPKQYHHYGAHNPTGGSQQLQQQLPQQHLLLQGQEGARTPSTITRTGPKPKRNERKKKWAKVKWNTRVTPTKLSKKLYSVQ